MMLMDVPEGERIVFEHGLFDFEKENSGVKEKMEAAMKAFDYEASGYRLDATPEECFTSITIVNASGNTSGRCEKCKSVLCLL